ncbi:hypothetical protein FC82_GL002025 [Secundilactobacillus collinoides DSM 20515 = JCM 1123]|uniref:Uncharacterized protein n=1 Tax=Secundilactobacillus collinoides DSM 20515 = JCM 1123 TaxID=1423733 RepID=A0A0R2B9F6_SECCO|nr:hypothetical protein FC82_GL002025 [Secundilactobacillus collinoides DSM 20515 = JCM 1123]
MTLAHSIKKHTLTPNETMTIVIKKQPITINGGNPAIIQKVTLITEQLVKY